MIDDEISYERNNDSKHLKAIRCVYDCICIYICMYVYKPFFGRVMMIVIISGLQYVSLYIYVKPV